MALQKFYEWKSKVSSVYRETKPEYDEIYSNVYFNDEHNEYPTVEYNIERFGINLFGFDGLDKITICGSKIKFLKNIPESVLGLEIEISNQISDLESIDLSNIGTNITELFINGFKDTDGEKFILDSIVNIPNSIELLKIYSVNGYDISYDYFFNLTNLQELNIEEYDAEKLVLLPSSLKKLYIESDTLFEIETLPENLMKLKIKCSKIKALDNLPSNLILLEIRDYCIENLSNIPNNLKKLSISLPNNTDSRISLDKLPEDLKYLVLGKGISCDVSNFPTGLNVFHCFGKLEGTIPKNLTILTLYQIDENIVLQLQSGSLSNLEELTIYENKDITDVLELNIKNLKKLRIVHCSYTKILTNSIIGNINLEDKYRRGTHHYYDLTFESNEQDGNQQVGNEPKYKKVKVA